MLEQGTWEQMWLASSTFILRIQNLKNGCKTAVPIELLTSCLTGSSCRPAFNDDVAGLQRLSRRRDGRRRRQVADVGGFDGRRRRAAVVGVATAARVGLFGVRRRPENSATALVS